MTTLDDVMDLTRPRKRGPKPRPLAERFAAFVDVNGPIPVHRPELGPCHIWKASLRPDGYGQVNVGGRPLGAHVAAFFLANGRMPDPCALHHCDNPACVKAVADEQGPSHIFEGTQTDNMRDCAAKGRTSSQTHPEHLARGERHGRSKLTVAKVRIVRKMLEAGDSQRKIAKAMGVHQHAIWRVANAISWKETV